MEVGMNLPEIRIFFRRHTRSKRKKNILSSENKKKEKYPFFFS
jgi:hypothetical protein